MERSVNSLLDYARPEKSELTQFAIQEVTRRTVQLISCRCELQKVQLTVVAPSQAIQLLGDPAQIQQLLLNLVLNSLDAMPNGGNLELETTLNDSEIEIAVRDSGPGIEANMMENLFTPFVTNKPNGVGLGLGICRRIAEWHHGSLSGSNRPTSGAQFLLKLPVPSSETTQLLLTSDEICRVS